MLAIAGLGSLFRGLGAAGFVAPTSSNLAGSWAIAVRAMDGQSGVLRIGATGRAIGIFYNDRERMLQPIVRLVGNGPLVGFSVWRDTSRFHDPGFQETFRSTTRIAGTWSSGMVLPHGYGIAGAGNGSWSATRISATWAKPSVLEPLRMPTGDAPGIACTISDERGRTTLLQPILKNVETFYDTTTHSLRARGGGIALAFDRLSATPQAIDFTQDGTDPTQGVIGSTHDDIASSISAYDAFDYQAATGTSPGWRRMTAERRGASTRLRATEVFRVSRRIVPTKIDGVYRFEALDVLRVGCSVVADIPTHPQHLSPGDALRRAAETLK